MSRCRCTEGLWAVVSTITGFAVVPIWWYLLVLIYGP